MTSVTDKFTRDPTNPGSLCSNDLAGLQAYKKRKQVLKSKDDHIKAIEERLNNIEKMILEMRR